jgi:hypothetical protein
VRQGDATIFSSTCELTKRASGTLISSGGPDLHLFDVPRAEIATCIRTLPWVLSHDTCSSSRILTIHVLLFDKASGKMLSLARDTLPSAALSAGATLSAVGAASKYVPRAGESQTRFCETRRTRPRVLYAGSCTPGLVRAELADVLPRIGPRTAG